MAERTANLSPIPKHFVAAQSDGVEDDGFNTDFVKLFFELLCTESNLSLSTHHDVGRLERNGLDADVQNICSE